MENNSSSARKGFLIVSHFDALVPNPHQSPIPARVSSQDHNDLLLDLTDQPQESESRVAVTTQTPHMLRHEAIQYYPYQTEHSKQLIAEVVDLRAKLPAPFPTPVAFSYANFNTHIWDYPLRDGIRGTVGKELVGAMLSFYFEGAGWEVRVVPNLRQGVVETVPWEGTAYYAVSRLLEEGGQAALLVVVATARELWEHKDRTQPKTLAFAERLRSAGGQILLNEKPFQRGHVVLLCGRGHPPRAATRESLSSSQVGHPQWEFYTFDARRGREAQIVPWYGQTRTEPGYGTNSFSLANDEAEKVDRLFKSISEWSEKDWETLPKFDMPAQIRRRTSAAPAGPYQSTSGTPAQRTRHGGARARSKTPDVRKKIAVQGATPAPNHSQSRQQTPAPVPRVSQAKAKTPTPREPNGRFIASRSTTPVEIPYHPFRGNAANAMPAPTLPSTPLPTLPPTATTQPVAEENETLSYLRQFGLDSLGRLYNKSKGGSVNALEAERVKQLAREVGFEIPEPMKRKRRR